ncbi:hypothetical protein B296_00005334 [Ensete ventricosum]|uniref:Uncharacterized protein n=1 Tax=Ensete ventricosum TaxID=4639 RepID=A0A427AZ86_ENSVE|nr:hypothetical protein B296_00005334 [Ensete ventricosum]
MLEQERTPAVRTQQRRKSNGGRRRRERRWTARVPPVSRLRAPQFPRVAPSVVVGWLLRACSRGTRGEGRRAPRRHPSPRRCSPGRRAATPPHDRSSAAYPDDTTVHVLASPPRFLAGPAGLTGWLAREGLRSLYADISISSILPERPYGGRRR